MDHLSLASLLVCLASFINAGFVLLVPPWNLLKGLSGLISLIIGLMGMYLFLSLTSYDWSSAYYYSLTLNSAAIFIPVLFFHFAVLFTGRLDQKKTELFLYYLITIAYALAVIMAPKLFISNVTTAQTMRYSCQPGILFYFLPFWFLLLMGYGLSLIHRKYRKSAKEKRKQLKYLFFGSAIGVIGAVDAFLPMLNIPVYPWGVYLIPISLLIIAYSIVRYQLMEIHIVIKRNAAFSISILLLSSLFLIYIYGIERYLQYLFGYKSNSASFFVLILISIMSIPVFRFAQSLVERFIYKKSINQISIENKSMHDQIAAMMRYKSFDEVTDLMMKELDEPLSRINAFSTQSPIEQDAIYLTDILNQLKEYTQPIKMELNQFNITELIEIIAKRTEESIEKLEQVKKPLVFRYYQPGEIIKINASRHHLETALWAIFDHCITVVGRHGGDIFISLDFDSKWINLSIRHSGLGLTPKESKEVFKPFFKNADYVSGLKLFAALSVIQNHQGKIIVDADEDNGTEFLIELPLR